MVYLVNTFWGRTNCYGKFIKFHFNAKKSFMVALSRYIFSFVS